MRLCFFLVSVWDLCVFVRGTAASRVSWDLVMIYRQIKGQTIPILKKKTHLTPYMSAPSDVYLDVL